MRTTPSWEGEKRFSSNNRPSPPHSNNEKMMGSVVEWVLMIKFRKNKLSHAVITPPLILHYIIYIVQAALLLFFCPG